MKFQTIIYPIIAGIGIGAAFSVALDDMAVGMGIGAAYGIGILPAMLKSTKCGKAVKMTSQEEK
jgi:hypothetical protein